MCYFFVVALRSVPVWVVLEAGQLKEFDDLAHEVPACHTNGVASVPRLGQPEELDGVAPGVPACYTIVGVAVPRVGQPEEFDDVAPGVPACYTIVGVVVLRVGQPEEIDDLAHGVSCCHTNGCPAVFWVTDEELVSGNCEIQANYVYCALDAGSLRLF